MTMKFSLPEPEDGKDGIARFFAQLRVVVKAAERAYEESVKNLGDVEKELWFVAIRVPEISQLVGDKIVMEPGCDELNFPKIDIEIGHL